MGNSEVPALTYITGEGSLTNDLENLGLNLKDTGVTGSSDLFENYIERAYEKHVNTPKKKIDKEK